MKGDKAKKWLAKHRPDLKTPTVTMGHYEFCCFLDEYAESKIIEAYERGYNLGYNITHRE